MKKLYAMLICVLALLCVTMTACGSNTKNSPDSSKTSEAFINLSSKRVEMDMYDAYLLKVQYKNVTGEVQYTSSNPNVASVDNTGKVISKSAGETVITAKIDNLSDTCTIAVENSGVIPTLTVDYDELNLVKDSDFNFNAKITYNGRDISKYAVFTCSSSNNDLLSLENDGSLLKITTKATGDAVVTINADLFGTNLEKSIPINVVENEVLLLDDIGMKGADYEINLCCVAEETLPSAFDLSNKILFTKNSVEVTDFTATYSSSNENVVRVNSNGEITAVSGGQAKIFIEVEGNTLSLNVNVKRGRVEVNDKTYTLSLFDKDTYLDNGTFGYKQNDTIAFSNPSVTGSITQVRINDKVVYEGNVALDGNPVNITIDLSNISEIKLNDVKTITFATDSIDYEYAVKAYTQILTTKEDVQNWLDVAIGLKHLNGGKVTGNFILGENITSDSYWNYTPKANSGDFDYSSYKGFEGTFDGNGHYIEKMNINDTSVRVRTAFIPTLAQNGVIKNVAFIDCKFTADAKDAQWGGPNFCGFVTAYSAGTISDLYVDMELTSTLSGQSIAGTGVIASEVNSSANVQRCFVYGRSSNITIQDGYKFKMGINTDVPNGANVSNVYGISSSGYQTKFANGTIIGKKTDTEAEMISAGINFAEIFTSSVWEIDANGLPKFASTNS